MKHILLYLGFLCLITLQGFAQNWQPLRNGEIYNYQHSDSQTISHTVWVDSVRLEGQDSVFYLNRIVEHIPGTQGGFDSCYSLNNPQFLQRRMIVKNSNTYIFEDTTRIVILPFASIGQSWLYDTAHAITATVASILPSNTFLQPDSLKTFTLSNGKVIVLSKNYGIYTFPSNGKVFQLMGLQTQQLGLQLPTWQQLFDFQIGDMFYAQASSNYHYNSVYGVSNLSQKKTILQRVDYADSVHYNIEIKSYGMGQATTIDTVEETYPQYPSMYTAFKPNTLFFDEMHPGINRLTSIWGRQSINESDIPQIHTVGLQYNASHDTACPIPILGPGGDRYNISFGVGLGRIHEHSEHSDADLSGSSVWNNFDYNLVGYIQNNDTTGIIYEDWLFTEVESPIHQFFRLYPNPAQTHLYLSWSHSQNATFSITNLMSKIFLAETQLENSTTYEIPVREWAQGVYFIQVQDEKGNIHTEKFIKE